ncbi:hypothetical protein [Sphingomonas lycopersici]|uniref:Uncharacterized protein n=1 Tax=Sphingomonas lycopersici TaxID=2951807 RepID=A0AA42CQF1_9SPHN|nr:hypothetical protein [Sphingomonas lycopersici]MCW6535625.1 hypothetical protein [Sphingomonas lycopersici]
MRGALSCAIAALSLVSPAAFAATPAYDFQASEPVKDKPTVALASDRAYVYLRSAAAIPIYLVREPEGADLAAYDRFRAAALAEAREKYAKKLAAYQAEVKQAKSAPVGTYGVVPPFKDVEPTAENFEATPFYMLSKVAIGPLNRFAKGSGGESAYLHALKPGTYRLYGAIAETGNAITGTCLCMGSVRFTARAGEVVDMGRVFMDGGPGISAGDVMKAALTFGLAGKPKGKSAIDAEGLALEPATAAMPVDPRLAALKVRAADFRPSGKLPNYYGLRIDRLPAIAGVMRYERDRIVDLTVAK